MMKVCLLFLAVWCAAINGLLYPEESETRQIRSLDGLWSFRLDEQGMGETERWFALPNLPEPTILMPVPASYNDITQNVTIHRHIGWVWYARDFFVHNTAPRWVLRFQAARYESRVWVNGQSAVNHSGGHLPFECDITPFIPAGPSYSKVRVVVAVNNTLTATTLPPGYLHIYSDTYRYLETPFDFFNYAGIDHSVILYSTSTAFIQDIAIDTQSIDYDGQHVATSATLTYSVTIAGADQTNAIRVLVELLDADGTVVVNNTDYQSQLVVNKPHLWEPCGMNHTHPCTEESYLYTLQVTLYNDEPQKNVLDIYRIPHVGIRMIRVTDSKFLVNERPFYFHGANAHEDSDIRGKGFDRVILAKHFNLYGWLHGNSFRTSHYPYAEEFYSMADRFGIAIIGETPAVGLNTAQFVSQPTLAHHKQVITEMISRDKNHPSVLMWSLANEPNSGAAEAKAYFGALANFTRPIAAGRPITYVVSAGYNNDQGIQFYDMICVNRYFGWYSQPGRLDQVPSLISEELDNWRQKYPTKPILISEYGADTVDGLHNDPPFMFTEEYQKDFLSAYHASFDNVSSIIHPDTGYFVGELVWNAFDFATDQSITRVGGLNRKGIFNRQRQPKAAAFILKSRYEQLESIQTVNRETFC
jgi:beta-glucuronidase